MDSARCLHHNFQVPASSYFALRRSFKPAHKPYMLMNDSPTRCKYFIAVSYRSDTHAPFDTVKDS